MAEPPSVKLLTDAGAQLADAQQAIEQRAAQAAQAASSPPAPPAAADKPQEEPNARK